MNKQYPIHLKIDVCHAVSAGVFAPDRDAALAIARNALAAGEFWDDSQEMLAGVLPVPARLEEGRP